MIINHNLAANNAIRNMNINSTAASKSMQKLSSGLRINSAADDAAGLAISEKMRGQIRGLDQASSNAQDATSLIGTAEGALNETTSILQRMRELSVQSSSDTQTDADRGQIQKEMTQLTNEVDRIATTTQFNTKNLLDGSMGKAVNVAVKNVNTTSVSLHAVSSTNGTSGNIAVSTTMTQLGDQNNNNVGIKIGDKITVSYFNNTNTQVTAVTTVATGTSLSGVLKLMTAASSVPTIVANKVSVTAKTAGTGNGVYGISIIVADGTGVTRTAATNLLSSFAETTQAKDVRTNGQATFQIGANMNQNLQLAINDMGTAALGIKDIQVTTQNAANAAIKQIDAAIQTVSTERANLGANQNRLEHTIANLGTSSENLTASESRIRDVDMAKEMSTFSKNNILAQAAQAMLAQANQQPQQVLQLLR